MVRRVAIGFAALAGVVALLLVTGVVGPSDAPITEVYVRPGGTQLEVGVGTCNQNPQVTAEETSDEVRLSSNEAAPRGASDDCQDASVVTLDAPLGDRVVVDEASGDVVRVRTAD